MKTGYKIIIFGRSREWSFRLRWRRKSGIYIFFPFFFSNKFPFIRIHGGQQNAISFRKFKKRTKKGKNQRRRERNADLCST